MNSRWRYPWLGVYGTVSMTVAVVVASLAMVAAFAAFFVVGRERGDAAGVVAAVGIAFAGFWFAVTLGIAADVVKWMQDMVALQEEQRDLLRRRD